MKRAVAAAAVLSVAAVLGPEPATAAYAGRLRTVDSTFRIRGTDQAVYQVQVRVRTSGYGTSNFRQLELTVATCKAARCVNPKRHVTKITAQQGYIESLDHSLTTVIWHLGAFGFGVQWTSRSAFGDLPPRVGTSNGASVEASQQATATLLAGRWTKDGFVPAVKCLDRGATVSSAVVVSTSEVAESDSWGDRAPGGLTLKKHSKKSLSCA